ncbi:MocR-like pyridoxine biosynthesis transcription factor PdxR [Rugamonas rivuli]|uniref:Aminotransferase class I/II-fold pyridoxal phosphate-dependent enzyme n=1 Tax=Rugamonas rivuli TaxID=2743358 RepID=A0A843SPL5_9BURK|nr:PLP-dependent aminotransferase family protein [Rugamonas rivuli]MQA22196.1 aminotransferase class I/II-fold pyridoxal phosphate-dependent enzyme [Rugamonas rivuli]
MKNQPDFLQLDTTAAEPLYRQIYIRFRNAIAEGLLLPEARIPSARALALELGLARGTVEAAYSLLVAEGYVETRGQAGTIVTPALARHATTTATTAPARAPRTRAHPTTSAASAMPTPLNRPFQMGLPALDAFPRKVWARLAARAIRATQPDDMAYPPFAGQAPLRAAIATYLQLSRGIDCTPSQVFITSGYRNTLELVTRALLQPGDGVWVEDPGFPPTSELLKQAGMKLAPVAVDADGLVVSHGIATAPRAKAAIVTPAHQSPLCVALSLPRRLALLDWAKQADAWIVEDDYDGEYRYASRPLPALQSLDRDGRVLYAGTFSKVLFPAVRLAYLVVPPAQVARFEQISQTFAAGGPALMQTIVSDFMNEGHFARHIQRMRRLYAERRQIAAEGLGAVLGKHLRIDPQPGGMHLVLRMKGRHTDRALAERMRQDGMAALALSERSVLPHAASALLLAFTNIDTPQRARELGKRILRLM